MNVLFLTVFVGLILVGFAIAFFAFTRRSSASSSPERDSLMPLEDEKVVRPGSSRRGE
ncbi:hypothetical protein [Pelagicoccus sp. SDUM812003]|uniref:hypothetical protein n=1 Tax=Pelagicoccus sp. SDUM812003 TaxID=3041267 RepID=UPI00280F4326|nr:hypothetical protein [Pelagicoccus sp. SDUM812003]MDQ8203611.1 hypothetical protein [Pelagicoccus sp. SDUM812003]